MRKLFFHLGLHKTGTSYLQALLVRNRELLEAFGLAVPPATHKDSHEQYALALRDGGAQAFFDLVDWRLGEHQVISSERVGSLICTRRLELAPTLANLAARQGIELNILLLLRRQDILKESLYSEVVKTWYEGSIEEEQHYDYDFNQRLEYLEDAFGIENINVAIYRKHGPMRLAELFLVFLRLDMEPSAMADVDQKNVRMNRRETMFLSQVPKNVARATPRASRVSLLAGQEAVRLAVERNDFIRNDGQENLMSPSQRAAFLERFRAGNDALMARYGLSDPTWTHPDFGDESSWSPPHAIEPQEYIAVMMEAVAISWAEARQRTRSES